MAAHAYSVIDSYIYAFALQQMALPLETSKVSCTDGGGLPPAAPHEFPHLSEMVIEHAMKPGYDYKDEFEFGLDLILDGLERLRA